MNLKAKILEFMYTMPTSVFYEFVISYIGKLPESDVDNVISELKNKLSIFDNINKGE